VIHVPQSSAFDSPLWLDLARVVAAIQADLQSEAETDELPPETNAARGCGRRLSESTIRALGVSMAGEDT